MPKAGIIRKLKTQQSSSLNELLEMIQEARENIAGKITAAAKGNATTSYSRREKLYKGIRDYYNRLGNDIDDWGREMTQNTAKNWFNEAITDIHKAEPDSIVNFDPERVKTYWQMIHPDNEQNLAAVFTDKMATEDVRSLRQGFVEVFRRSSIEGMTHREINKALQDRWNDLAGDIAADRFVDSAGRKWDNARYFQMLVRTTTARVARESYIDTLVANEDDLMRIVNVGETCELCEAWDDLIISITGTNKDYPSYQEALDAGWGHPNCFIGEQEVTCPGILSAYRFRYSGDLIRLKLSSGAIITVTPNHPILTMHGFVPAKMLMNGDQLISQKRTKNMPFGNPHINGNPSRIADVFMALSKTSGMSAGTMPLSAEYFHGDAAFGQDKVNIVSPNSLLLGNNNPARAQSISNSLFNRGNSKSAFFAGQCSLNSMLIALACATNRIVGKKGDRLPVLGSSIGKKQFQLLSYGSNSTTGFLQSRRNSQSRQSKLLGQVVNAFSSIIILDKIVNIDVCSSVHTFVYDLQTVSSLYIAGFSSVSNCDCMMERVDETIDAKDIEKQAEAKNPKNWNDVEQVEKYQERATEKET